MPRKPTKQDEINRLTNKVNELETRAIIQAVAHRQTLRANGELGIRIAHETKRRAELQDALNELQKPAEFIEVPSVEPQSVTDKVIGRLLDWLHL